MSREAGTRSKPPCRSFTKTPEQASDVVNEKIERPVSIPIERRESADIGDVVVPEILQKGLSFPGRAVETDPSQRKRRRQTRAPRMRPS